MQDAEPSRVDYLINLIYEIYQRKLVGGESVFTSQLFPDEYDELLARVSQYSKQFHKFFHHELSYEYRESCVGGNQLIIFNRSAFHAEILEGVHKAVNRWCSHILNDKKSAVEAKTIAELMDFADDMAIPIGANTLRPDCSYMYGEHHGFPPVVFLVAWSHPHCTLEYRARELIKKSGGRTRIVVGLDFSRTYERWNTIRDQVGNEERPVRGPARICAYSWVLKRNVDREIKKKEHILCYDDGTVNSKAKIYLKMKDFIPQETAENEGWKKNRALDNVELKLDSATMVGWFNKALWQQKKQDESVRPIEGR